MSRAEALERYRELPVPDTTEEHWRFTDLKGFDPDAFDGNGAQGAAAADSMLELDLAAMATVTETGIEITQAPAEIRFEPLDQAHERLGSLVFVPRAERTIETPAEPKAEPRARRAQPSQIPRAGSGPLDPAAHGEPLAWPLHGVLVSAFGMRDTEQQGSLAAANPVARAFRSR